MRVRIVLTRPAPASIREFFSRLERERGPVIPVQRREIPYWRERGWTRNGRRYTGTYQTRYAAFQGQIEEELSGRINFFLYGPSAEIRSSGHWSCFVPRGGDWFLVHMARRPKDVSSGIITIEQLIAETYR